MTLDEDSPGIAFWRVVSKVPTNLTNRTYSETSYRDSVVSRSQLNFLYNCGHTFINPLRKCR